MAQSELKRRLGARLAVRRALPLLFADAALASGSLFAALLLRFEGDVAPRFLQAFGYSVGLAVVVKLLFLQAFRLYQVQWRYASLRELMRVVSASAIGTLVFTAILTFVQLGGYPQVMPRSVLIIDFLLATTLIGTVRIVPRLMSRAPSGISGRRAALVYGAGNAGEQLVRDMLKLADYPYFPAGFVDDEPRTWGTTIHGIRVLGDGNQLAAFAEQTGAETLIVAIPSLNTRQLRRVLQRARDAGIRETKTLPGLNRILSGKVTVNEIREVNLEDLMARDPVTIDTAAIEGHLRGKRILVTGAGGSIGSELVRQIVRFGPARICMLDHDETESYDALARLKASGAKDVEIQIADVRDVGRIDSVFAAFSPEVVFHAAAYKHVPAIEPHPTEAAKTNILGTRNVASAAARVGCEKFVLISTDKAVNPTSVMGVTKRIAEGVLRTIGPDGTCRFAAVRFGNVLGSRGSVVPVFREQIARGGPVTVTHPEMKRYFMTIHEACLLVLQAAALSAGGEVFVLDMGEPVKIVDLAREMIRLSGFEPDVDIPVSFSGIRPGEKLFEEYLTAEEGVDSTKHEKIFVARMSQSLPEDSLEAGLRGIEEACGARDDAALMKRFLELVPTYKTPDREREPAAERKE